VRQIADSLTKQVDDARRTSDFRNLYLFLGDRGKARMDLGLWASARLDFEEQRILGENEIKRAPELLSNLYASLGRAYKAEDNYPEAEFFLKKSLKPFNGTAQEKIETLQNLFEVYTLQEYKGKPFNQVKAILDDMYNEAESLELETDRLETQQAALEDLLRVCNYFGNKDMERITRSRLKRIQNTTEFLVGNDDSIPNSDEDENYTELVTISPPKRKQSPAFANELNIPTLPKRKKAVFANLGDETDLFPEKQTKIKKKNPVVVDSSQDSESFLDDFAKTVKLPRKKKYSKLI
jgi:hypothetical protein